MKEDNIYEIIAAFLAGESDEEQNDQLLEWLGQSGRNKQLFNDLKVTWNYAMADWDRMEKNKTEVFQKVISRVRRRRFLKPAAAAIALIGALALGFALAVTTLKPGKVAEPVMSSYKGQVTLTTLPGQKAQASLPDGTKVWLNSGTTITYPTNYGLTARTATLVDGEIFLEVAKKEEQPFILITSSGLIKVLGTSFDAKDYTSEPTMTVSLEKGEIEFYSSKNASSKAEMIPGQKLSVDKTSGAMMVQKFNIEFESVWRFGELKIERASFLDVMKEMERWYGVEITVTGNIPKNRVYWMTIKTESLREMLGLLRKITPLSYEIDGKLVSIKVK